MAAIAPTFGAIQLEDIRAPECFEIEAELKRRLNIPVMHDDQHGTAVVVLAALIAATKRAGVDLSASVVGQIGLGGCGARDLRFVGQVRGQEDAGFGPASRGSGPFARLGGTPMDLPDLMANAADVVVATTGVKGLIKPEMVRRGR